MHEKNASEVLKGWLLSHESNPYPSPAEKKHLMHLTGLNRSQLDHWFTNARQRYVRPKNRRGPNPNYSRYPQHVTKVLVDWLTDPRHINHPYPCVKEQAELMKKTKLSKRQLQNWFTNARKRQLAVRIRNGTVNCASVSHGGAAAAPGNTTIHSAKSVAPSNGGDAAPCAPTKPEPLTCDGETASVGRSGTPPVPTQGILSRSSSASSLGPGLMLHNKGNPLNPPSSATSVPASAYPPPPATVPTRDAPTVAPSTCHPQLYPNGHMRPTNTPADVPINQPPAMALDNLMLYSQFKPNSPRDIMAIQHIEQQHSPTGHHHPHFFSTMGPGKPAAPQYTPYFAGFSYFADSAAQLPSHQQLCSMLQQQQHHAPHHVSGMFAIKTDLSSQQLPMSQPIKPDMQPVPVTSQPTPVAVVKSVGLDPALPTTAIESQTEEAAKLMVEFASTGGNAVR